MDSATRGPGKRGPMAGTEAFIKAGRTPGEGLKASLPNSSSSRVGVPMAGIRSNRAGGLGQPAAMMAAAQEGDRVDTLVVLNSENSRVGHHRVVAVRGSSLARSNSSRRNSKGSSSSGVSHRQAAVGRRVKGQPAVVVVVEVRAVCKGGVRVRLEQAREYPTRGSHSNSSNSSSNNKGSRSKGNSAEASGIRTRARMGGTGRVSSVRVGFFDALHDVVRGVEGGGGSRGSGGAWRRM